MSQSTTCRSCGAPLAPDQRYCLACGTRVAAPRLDFLAEVERSAAADREAAAASVAPGAAGASSAVAVPAAGAAHPAPSKLDRVGGPMGVAAVLIVALGVGFLIGQGGDPQPVQQRAPVVNITGGLPAGGAGSAGTAADGDGDAATADGGDGGGSSGAGRGGRRSSASDAAAVERSTDGLSKAPPRASGDINRLRAEPDTTATPGAPPPTDDEPAGGGTEAETIG
jgi:hypothetical protein